MSRMEQVDELIKQEVSRAISKIAQPEMGFVTVMAARVEKDLKRARVMVSIYGEDPEKSFKLLKSKTHDIQELVNPKLTMKYTPKIELFLDTSVENADKIEQAIKEIEDEFKRS